MNLVVDIGNTLIKCGVFKEGALVRSFVTEDEKEVLNEPGIKKGIICSVRKELPAGLKDNKRFMLFTAQTPVPLKNKYRSAATLGSDRLAAAVGASHQIKGKPTLVIDAGTCLKYNFINAAGEYLGGSISPGLEMRFKALNAFTGRLPLQEKDGKFEDLIGTDTKGSMLSGVQEGIIAETDGIIDRYLKLYPGLCVILTGGDAAFFEKRLKNSIFADPFLVLKGLNIILEHNAK